MQLSIFLITSLLIVFSNFSLTTSLGLSIGAPEDHAAKETRSFSAKAPQLTNDAAINATEQPPKEAAHFRGQLSKEEPANNTSGGEKKQSPSPRVGSPPNSTAIPFATGSKNATHQDQHNTTSTSDTSDDDSLESGQARALPQVHPVAAVPILFFSWAVLYKLWLL